MAIKLKFGKTFNPEISEAFKTDMTGSDYYGVIDRIELNKAEKNCIFSIEVYGSKEARETMEANIFHRFNFAFRDDDFDDVIGNDGLTIPEAYQLALSDDILEDWESDE